MISVIIPTYKGASFLSRAINSVLRQEGVEFELIVVDDNDPDSVGRTETEIVMDQYSADKRIIYKKHDKNINGSAARNTGIKCAKGEYISFLDDDDYYLPGRLSKCERIMKMSSADMVYTDVLVTKNDIVSGYVNASVKGNVFKNLLLDENMFGTGSNIFICRKAIAKYGGFDETLPRQQDYEFLLRQSANGTSTESINECLLVKSMNGINNSVNYIKLKEIKLMLLQKYESSISRLEEIDIKGVYIAQYLELLHCAAETKDNEGIDEQIINLNRMGYSIGLGDKLKIFILKSGLKKYARKMVWKMKQKEIIKKHPEALLALQYGLDLNRK